MNEDQFAPPQRSLAHLETVIIVIGVTLFFFSLSSFKDALNAGNFLRIRVRSRVDHESTVKLFTLGNIREIEHRFDFLTPLCLDSREISRNVEIAEKIFSNWKNDFATTVCLKIVK